MNLNIEVRDELVGELNARAREQGVSPDRIATQILEDTLGAGIEPLSGLPPKDPRIWEVIAQNMSDLPLEEFEKLPRDGAAQVDHYLYGHPRR
jgi:hypothetical protein